MPFHPVPDNTGSYLAKIEARVRALETKTPMAMTLLGSVTNNVNVGPFGYNTVFQHMPECTVGPFTLSRPTPVLLASNMSFFDTGGTAEFILVYAGFSTQNVVGHNTDAVDISGNPAFNTDAVLTCGITAAAVNGGANSCANMASTGAFTLPAGTYYAHTQYCMVGGAGTTVTDNGSSTFVFALSG